MRYSVTENTVLLGKFVSGETVSITVYQLSTLSQETLTSSNCTEIGTTGIFTWNTTNISTYPSIYTEYLYIMTDSLGNTVEGKFVLGGIMDTIDGKVGNVDAKVANVQTTVDNIETNVNTLNTKIDNIDLDVSSVLSIVTDIQKYSRNNMKIDVVNKQLIIYDDDGVTPLRVYNIKDRNGLASVDEIFERVSI